MNLDQNPTLDQLRDMLRSHDDRAGDHVVWVTRSGDVRLDRLPRGGNVHEFVAAHPDMQLRLETFQAGNGYVGPEAAGDDAWIAELFGWLTRTWSEAKGRQLVVYRDFSAVLPTGVLPCP
jgi:hypothetical protein